MEWNERPLAHATLVRPQRAAATLILRGSLDQFGCAAIADVVAVAAEHAGPDLLVDGGEVNTVSAMALDMLIELRRRLEQRGGLMVVALDGGVLCRMIDDANLGHLFALPTRSPGGSYSTSPGP